MTVLHVIQRFPPAIGGAEAWCRGVALEQVRRGRRVEVVTLRILDEDALWDPTPRAPGPIAVGPLDLEPGIRVWRCAPSRTPYALLRVADRFAIQASGRFSAELAARAFAAARRADLVHLHHANVVSSFVGLAAARAARRPVVVTPHYHPGDPNHERPAARWLLRRADAVTADTAHEAELLAARGLDRRRIVVASIAVDASRFTPDDDTRAHGRRMLGIEDGTALVTFVGRKSHEKDLDVLVGAARRVATTRAIALALVGPRSDWYARVSASWETDGVRVLDLPAIDEETKPALLAASDVLVQPSPREAFGIVFLEAWASGVPVVGAAAGAVPDVVGDAGITFRPGESADLADKLGWLLDHPDERRAMAARGRVRVVHEHGWERVGDAIERAYALARGS